MKMEYGFLIFSLCVILARLFRNKSVTEFSLLIINLILLFIILFQNNVTAGVVILVTVAFHFISFQQKGKVAIYIAFVLPLAMFIFFRSLPAYGVVGVSYLFFRMLSASLEIKSGKVQVFSLRKYLSYCFFFHTFKMGPVGSFEDHLISEEIQRKKNWNDLNWLQLFRVFYGVVKYVLLAVYIRNFASAFGYTYWSDAGSISDLVILGFISYISTYLAFSGFNDISIGLSHFLGYRMKENFANPFKAGNVGEFWSNWHMSVTELLKDLIFFPLSITLLRKVGPSGRLLLMPLIYLVLFISIGVWHGAGENFICLGLYHAIGATIAYYFSLIMTRIWKGYKTSSPVKLISILITQIFIALSFFFFDNNLNEIREIINAL